MRVIALLPPSAVVVSMPSFRLTPVACSVLAWPRVRPRLGSIRGLSTPGDEALK